MYSYFTSGELTSDGDSIAEGIGQGRVTANVAAAKVDESFRIPDAEALPLLFDLLKHEAVGEAKLEGEALDQMCALTVELVAHVRQEIGIVGFWSKAQARDGLRSWIFMTLDHADVLPFERLDAVADKLMELSKANHHRLVS